MVPSMHQVLSFKPPIKVPKILLTRQMLSYPMVLNLYVQNFIIFTKVVQEDFTIYKFYKFSFSKFLTSPVEAYSYFTNRTHNEDHINCFLSLSSFDQHRKKNSFQLSKSKKKVPLIEVLELEKYVYKNWLYLYCSRQQLI